MSARKEEKDNDVLNSRLVRLLPKKMQTASAKGDQTMLKAISIACTLEGSVRQTGVHACGMLIGRDSLHNNIPLMRTKEEAGLAATQYEGSFVESIGLLKMDFLGLRTLSIIKECLNNIKLSRNIDVNIDVVLSMMKKL